MHNLRNGFGSKGTIPEVDEYVSAVYDQNVYVGKTIEVDQSEAHVIFFQNSEKIEKNTLFRMLKKKANSGYHLINSLSESDKTKRGRKFDEAIVLINDCFAIWQAKNLDICKTF